MDIKNKHTNQKKKKNKKCKNKNHRWGELDWGSSKIDCL